MRKKKNIIKIMHITHRHKGRHKINTMGHYCLQVKLRIKGIESKGEEKSKNKSTHGD